jgi:hypothetical protein
VMLSTLKLNKSEKSFLKQTSSLREVAEVLGWAFCHNIGTQQSSNLLRRRVIRRTHEEDICQ